MIASLRSWIAGFGAYRNSPAEDTEAGLLVPVQVVLDQVGDDPDVGLRRRWKEDCRSYRLRLQILLQEEIIRREKFEQFLSLLLKTDRS